MSGSTSSINSTGSKKGAVSSAVSYDTALKAAKDAITAQKKSETIASLKKANSDLQKKLNDDSNGYYSLNTQLKQQQSYLTYDKTMLVNNNWGNQPSINLGIYRTQFKDGYTTNYYTIGATLTLDDKTMIINDISATELKIDALNKQISTIQKAINKNNEIINGKPTGSDSSKNGTNLTPSKIKITADSSQTTVYTPPPEWPSNDYKWNLPPHAWSLPTDPADVNPGFNSARTDNVHATRRGRIWYYNGYVGKTNQAQYDYTSTGTFSAAAGAAAAPPPGSVNKYGFQFVWNPETYSQQTAVNMNVTPSGTDPTIALTGFAAANSTMQFTLRLDRTNDFMCAKNLVVGASGATLSDIAEERYLNGLSNIAPFYKTGSFTTNSTVSIEEEIKKLLVYGTEADLEYLYKVVNGDGWTGIGGRDTSNIGYLMPALIRVDLGNQKFVGVVSSISVTHLAFTKDMIPIRSDVNISIDLRANVQPTTNVSTGTKP